MAVADAKDSGFRGILGVVVALALGGCALPPALTVASFAVDGVSYASSGKSVQDHAISALAEQDCALWRVAKGDPVCSSIEAVAESQVAAAEPAPDATVSDAPVQLAQFTPPPLTPWAKVVPAPAPAARPEQPRAPEQAANPVSVATQAALAAQPAASATSVAAAAAVAPKGKAEPAVTQGLYVVLASFEDPSKAEGLARAKGGEVLAATVNGKTMHRVVAGPLDRAHAQQMRRENAGAWLITL